MKKAIYFITTIVLPAALLSLSSCLKDSYIDFSKSAPIVNFPLGGKQYFGADGITDPPANDANGTIVRQFAVNVAAPKASATPTNITLAVDNSIITTVNATSQVQYSPMPADAFSFTATTVTVPAGQQYVTTSVTFYKNKLNPSVSYMLPIKIVSAGGLNISGNMGIHYYHFIGNDFAGAFMQNFQRYNAADSVSAPLNGSSFTGQPTTFLPASSTEFTVGSGYAGLVYDINFTKNADGTYSNFTVKFTDASVAAFAASGTVVAPVFLKPPFPVAGPLTYAQALKIFHFQFTATTSGPRYLTDTFYKP